MKQVYGTQGGGLARKDGNRYVWAEPPEWAGDTMKEGDEIPQEWDIQGPFDQDNGMKQVPVEHDDDFHHDS